MFIKSFLVYFYKTSILPSLYFVVMWLCLTAAATLLVGDVIKGAGIVSAISLFHLVRSMNAIEMRGVFEEYAEPNEAQRK
jgi:preprotein translocase subunit SecY